MLRVALSQLTTHSRRFIAIGLAVMLSVAFLSATLMVNSSTQASLAASIGEAYRKAGLVATPADPGTFDRKAVEAASSSPAVKESYAQRLVPVFFRAGNEELFGKLRNLAPEGLEGAVLVSGRLPVGPLEAAIDARTAKQFSLAAGSVLDLRGADPSRTARVTVTGLIEASNDPFSAVAGQLLAPDALAENLADPADGYAGLQLALAPGADVSVAREDVAQRLAASGAAEATVQTAQEKVTAAVAMLSGGQDQLTLILLAFAGVALLVSTLVVANTFAVLVAQRTRELALLRCLGADKAQIRNSVLLEALVVGIVSSALGVLAATGLMSALVSWARSDPDRAFATLAVPPSAIAAGLLAGTLLTMFAALVPARAATAVAPLAALRPADDAKVGTRKGTVHLVCALLAFAAGVAALVQGSLDVNLPLALAGGCLSFVGVLLGATLFIPSVVALAGRLASPAGVPGKLASVNALRNPGRTSATAAALLIGVTLVSMMMTGASTAREGFNATLAANYPVDLSAQTAPGSDPVEAVERINSLDGVSKAVALRPAGVPGNGGAGVYTVSQQDAADVLRDERIRPRPGTVYLPEGSPAGPVTLPGADGAKEYPAVVLETRNLAPFMIDGAPAAPATATAAGPAGLLWVKLDDTASADRILVIRKEMASILGVPEHAVNGAAIERVTFNSIIDVLLLVVTGLLAVAVVIALIGVANTLSLSVLERTRENSLLRALGLTKGQLRGMLAIEAVLVAGVAAVLGAVLGAVYGWLGARSSLGGIAHIVPVVPWWQLLAVFGVAVVAGLLASVLPARRAARLSPVEGLATD